MQCNNRGFTIVELMIATMVFSAVSLLTIVAVMGMARQYQKGSYTAQLNDASRTVHQDITSTIAYINKDEVSSIRSTPLGVSYFCVNRTMYYWSYPNATTIKPGLFKKQLGDVECNDTQANGGVNLLPSNGFVNKLTIERSPTNINLFDISTQFNVGSADMFKDTTYTQCLPTLSGGDFCSIVGYNSSVMSRI